MTIYKWWPSKGALALDGYFHRVDPELVFPDTGDIEADLRAQLHSFLRVIRDSPAGPVIGELIGQAQSDPELKAAYLQRYSSTATRKGRSGHGDRRRNAVSCARTWTPRRWWTNCGVPAITGCCCRISR